MRRFFGITLAVLVVCLVVGNVAMAQGRGRGGPGGGMFIQSPAMLISREEVQKELKMTDDQVAKANAIRDELFAGFRRGGGGGQQLSDEERKQRDEERKKKGDESNQKALALLTAEQTPRLKQIEIWANGLGHALTENADVAKALSLTDDQKGAVKTIAEESGKKLGEAGSGFRGADADQRTKIAAQMDEMRKEAETEMMAVLTDDQKARLETLRGPKFDLPRPQFGGPRGRGGRPGANTN